MRFPAVEVRSPAPIHWATLVLLALVFLPGAGSGVAGAQNTSPAITLGATLSIVAGNGTTGYSGDGGLALNAELSLPTSVALDGAGNYYFVDQGGTVVRKVAAKTGIITTVAGATELNFIADIAIDAAGDIYIAESTPDGANRDIRKVDASTGIISTVVSSLPGPITPGVIGIDLALDERGNLYFTVFGQSVIYELSAGTGRVSVVAGNGTSGYSGDGGPATAAELSSFLNGIAVDPAGNLYICDSGNNRIRKVDAATGTITTIVGDGVANNSGDGGQAAGAELNSPYGIASDNAGNLYIAVSVVGTTDGSSLIREVNASTGVITTVVGNGKGDGGGLGGSPTSTGLASVGGLAVGSPGDIYLTEYVAGINSFAADQVLEIVTRPYLNFPATGVGGSRSLTAPLDVHANGTTITGISAPVSEGGKQEYAIGTPSCTLNAPLSAGSVCNVPITFHPAYPGERLVPLRVATSAGTFNFGMVGLGTGPQVALTPGIVSTVAGNGTRGFSGNGGPAKDAEFYAPASLFVNAAGDLYILDDGNQQIRKVDAATGIVTNAIGSPTSLLPTVGIDSFTIDAAGNFYIVQEFRHRILKVSADTGQITTVAGNGTQGFSGDGGPATSAELDFPNAVAVDSVGNLYITDGGDYRIRTVDAATGIISTIAGNGVQGDSGDGGPATKAELSDPHAIALDAAGDIYFTDANSTNGSGADVRKIDAETGIITTVAGTGVPGYSGDGGPATQAQLNGPADIALDSAGNLYIADFGNYAIREVSAATGIIHTIVGNGNFGSAGDGSPANRASITPLRIALDSQGNLYFANSIQSPTASFNTVREVNVSAGWLNFAATPVGTTSADSPQTATFLNIGNEEMTLNVPSSGTNPAISNPSFTLNNGGTCPQLDTTSKPKALDSGDDCTFLFEFTPIMSGAIDGTATVSDNALHLISSTQVVHLNGVGTGTGTVQPADFTLTATPPSETVSSGLTATYTVTASGTGGFTGTVALTATGLPPGMTLNFSQTNVTVSGSPANSTLTISTAPGHARQMAPGIPFGGEGGLVRYGSFLLPLPLFGVVRLRKRLRLPRRTSMLIVFLLVGLGALAAGLSGCANIGLAPTTETYNLTVTGISGSLRHSVPLTLNVSTYKEIKY